MPEYRVVEMGAYVLKDEDEGSRRPAWMTAKEPKQMATPKATRRSVGEGGL